MVRGFSRHFFIPQSVVLLGPLLVDLALAHGIKCPLHPDRPDVNMGDRDGDEDKGDDGVPELSQLHLFMRGQGGWQLAESQKLR